MRLPCHAALQAVLLITAIATVRADASHASPASSSQSSAQTNAGTALEAPTAEASRHSLLLGVMAAYALDNGGMKYGPGVGIRAGLDLHHFYLGATFLLHQGDEVEIGWGSTILASGGRQTYDMLPMLLVAEAGYAIQIPIAGRRTELVPFLSLGTALIHVSTSGVYGDTSLNDTRLALGWGLGYRAALVGPWSLGVEYRMYPLGDGHFEFGDSAQGSHEHGFSTSVFHHAFLAECAYRFEL